MAEAICMADVVFGYESGPEILHINRFSVAEGRRVFLFGSSGSGKTTLLGLITGIITPRSGICEVLGHDLKKLSAAARDELRGSEMGYIFQSLNLINYLSVRENIELPCRIHSRRRARIVASTLHEETLRICGRLEIVDLLHSPVNKLSTGQQQRVAIARAVIGRPPLVIADEPTSALDADRRDRFLELLLEICDEADSTLLFVSHDRALMSRFSEQVSIDQINTLGRSDEVRP